MSHNIANTSTSTIAPTASLPTVEEINGWDRDRVKGFLQEKRAELGLEENVINVIYDQEVSGKAFLRLNEEQLTRDPGPFRLKYGPASAIAELVKQIKGEQPVVAGTSKSSTRLVSVFVDNSKLFIEGKFTVGRLESAGTFDQQRNSNYLNQLHIDHGRLLSTVLKGRQMGSNPIIVGSRPPPNDSLWDRIESQGYDVVVFDRNIENKEKKVDMELGASAMDVIWTRDPGIFVLVSGDGDYFPVVRRALNHNWKVETWFWRSGVSGDLTECSSSFYPLDNYYKYFTCAYGQDPVGKNHILEITDGETVGNWKGEEVMDCFFSLQLFGWWYRKERRIIYLYFDNKSNLKKVKNWMESKHSDIKVWEMPEKRRSWVVG